MSQRSRARRERQQRNHRLLLGGLAGAATVILVAAGVVAFVGGEPDDSTPAGTRVSMTEYAFEPDPIVVDAEAPALQVVNDGAIAHNLLITALGKGAPDLDPGESFVLELEGIEPGTYPVVCDLPGHTEAGMVTDLIVR